MIRTTEIDPDVLTANIMAVVRQANLAHWRDGLDWYPARTREIRAMATERGVSFDVACAVVAVLSPQLRWNRNMEAADAMLRGDAPVAVLGSSVRKAHRILAGENITDVLGGPKVCAFYQNLRGDLDHVTVDVHAIDAAVRDLPLPRNGVNGKRYALIADAFRAVAALLGLAPALLQAVAWVTWKDVFYTKDRRGIAVGVA